LIGHFGAEAIEPTKVEGGEDRGICGAETIEDGVAKVDRGAGAERLRGKIANNETGGIEHALKELAISFSGF
jgi:hypothetical protein